MASAENGSFLPRAIGITGGIAIAGVAFWFFRRQANRVVSGKTLDYDAALLKGARGMASPEADHAFRLATWLGTHPAVGTIAGLTALTMVRRGRPHDAYTVIASTGGAMVVNTLLKRLFRRQRPEGSRLIRLPKSHSFPSGHSLMAAATFPIIAHHLVENRGAAAQLTGQAIAGITILSVGFSRVYFGVHFPSDVLAGFAAGFGWLGLTSLTHTLVDQERVQGSAPGARKLPSTSESGS
jgi:membrane-associated phospholipid phosphatase